MKKLLIVIALSLSPITHFSQTPPALNPEAVCLAQNIYHEARGEPFKGKIAVALTVVNRTQSSNFPDTICGVIKQPGQFPWPKKSFRAALEYYDLALEIMEGKYDSYNLGYLYFHNKTVSPRWNKVKVAVIGNHIFYK